MAATETTRLHRPWVIRMVFLFVLFQGFGLWFLYDAMVVYPERGAAFAEYKLMEYLREAKEAGRLGARVSVEKPELRYEELKERQTASPETMSALQQRRLAWLTALDVVGRVSPEYTVIENPEQRLSELEAHFATTNPPKPLSHLDIPSQWLFFVLCTVVALAVLFVFLKAARVRYRWDPQAKRLTLPGGASLVPSDLEDIDKTKWHKYFVTLQIGPEHERLGGSSIRLDLLRHQPLERWVLEMEKERFPERVEEEEAEAIEPEGASDEGAAGGPEDETAASPSDQERP